ncbi:MAG TPA: peptide deformylase [Anaerolineae bacterium]|nr:peptide deformylase [Anaerolineae bacterium]
MTVRTVLTMEHPSLRQQAGKVRTFGPALQRLADDMLETMRDEPGIGLAANQIGVSQRVIVVELTKDEDDPQSGRTYVVVNPKIARSGREQEEMEEGCLSVPGVVGDVWREVEITVKGQDLQGKKIRIKARDMLARVFQHEMDHLDGIVFIDRIDDPAKIRRYVRVEDAETEEQREAVAGLEQPSADSTSPQPAG